MSSSQFSAISRIDKDVSDTSHLTVLSADHTSICSSDTRPYASNPTLSPSPAEAAAESSAVDHESSSSAVQSSSSSLFRWFRTMIQGSPVTISYAPIVDSTPISLRSNSNQLTHIKTVIYSSATPVPSMGQLLSSPSRGLYPLTQTHTMTTAVNLFQDLSEQYPLLLQFSELTIQIEEMLTDRCRCFTSTSKHFLTRIQQTQQALTDLLAANMIGSTIDFNSLLVDLCGLLTTSLTTFRSLTSTGYLKILLMTGGELEEKINYLDTRLQLTMAKVLSEDAVATLSRETQSYLLSNNHYHLHHEELGEDMILRARGHRSALLELGRRIEVKDVNDLKQEVFALAESILSNHKHRLSSSTISSIFNATHSAYPSDMIIKNASMREFWGSEFNEQVVVSSKDFAAAIGRHIRQHYPAARAEVTAAMGVSHALVESIHGKQVEEAEINLYALDRLTRHLHSKLNFLACLMAVSHPCRKCIPALPNHLYYTIASADQTPIVWGNGIKELVEASLSPTAVDDGMRGTRWTIVSGGSLVGKSYRWLVAAHELPSAAVVIWFDLIHAQSARDVYSAIISQLSLPVNHAFDQAMFFDYLHAFLLYSRDWQGSSHRLSIILDHISIELLTACADLFQLFSSMRELNLVCILADSSAADEALSLVRRLSSRSDDEVTAIAIEPLTTSEAVELAQLFDAEDAQRVVQIAGTVPGKLLSLIPFYRQQLDELFPTSSSASSEELMAIITRQLPREEAAIVCYLSSFQMQRTPRLPLHWLLPSSSSLAAMQMDEQTWCEGIDYLVAIGWLRHHTSIGCIGLPASSQVTQPISSAYAYHCIAQIEQINEILSLADDASLDLGSYLYDSYASQIQALFLYLLTSSSSPVSQSISSWLASRMAALLYARYTIDDRIAIYSSLLHHLIAPTSQRADPRCIGCLPRPAHPSLWKHDDELRVVILGIARMLGWQHALDGRIDDAIAVLESVIPCFLAEEEVDRAICLEELMHCYCAINQPLSAIAVLEARLAILCRHPILSYKLMGNAWRELGGLLEEVKRYDAAVDAYNKAYKCFDRWEGHGENARSALLSSMEANERLCYMECASTIDEWKTEEVCS
jgi:tetratricopeptide (TPR) repeat protein